MTATIHDLVKSAWLYLGTLLFLSATITGIFMAAPSNAGILTIGLLLSGSMALAGCWMITESSYRAVLFLFFLSGLVGAFVMFTGFLFGPVVTEIYFKALMGNCIFGMWLGASLNIINWSKQALNAMQTSWKVAMKTRRISS